MERKRESGTIDFAGLPVERVSLDRVETGGGPFCMSYGRTVDDLARSIAQVGLVHTPLLVEIDGRLEIVTGHRRIDALKSLGTHRAACRRLPPHSVSRRRCLLIALHENLLVRTFNPIEIGMALERLCGHFPESEVISDYLPLFGLNRNPETLRRHRTLTRDVEPAMQAAVARGTFSLRAVQKLLQLPEKLCQDIFDLLQRFILNTNQQTQAIDYIADMVLDRKEPITNLLAHPAIREILDPGLQNPPQQARRLLHFLRSRRYPRLVAAEERFRQEAANLCMPKGVTLRAPPFFEACDYRLEILFHSRKQLQTTLAALASDQDLLTLADREPE